MTYVRRQTFVPRLLLFSLGALLLISAGFRYTTGDRLHETQLRNIVIHPVGNEMRFAETEFTVKAGETVRLVFENTATVEAMSHNVVVLTQQDKIERVGLAALSAVASDYIPDDKAILFHTPLAAPGKTVEVTFTAPSAKGAYPYICTFPGHFVLMRGLMVVG